MAETTTLQILIEAENKTKEAISQVQKDLGGIGSAASAGFGALQTAGKYVAVGLGAAAAGIAAFGVSSVKAFADAEASQARFEQAMKAVAHASDQQISALRDQQLALQQTTRFEDDAIASAQGFLATFQLSADQVKFMTPHLLDMAEGLRDSTGATMGLEQASNMLGKAIQLGTVGMLAKAGVTIPGTTKAMQDLWKKHFELANIQDRVKMVGDLLDGNFKGQAETAGKTYAGAIDRLKNNFGNLQESIGGVLSQSLLPFIQKLNELVVNPATTEFFVRLIDKLKALSETVKTYTAPAVEFLKNFFSDMENRKAAIVAVLTVLTAAFVAWGVSVLMAIGPVVLIVGGLMAAVFLLKKGWDENFMGMADKVKFVWGGMTEFYNQYLVPLFAELKREVGEIVKWWQQNWDAIAQVFQGAWEIIRGIFKVAWALLSGAFKVGIDIMTGNWKKAFEDIGKIFSNVWNGIKDVFAGVWDAIQGIFKLGINHLIDGINVFIKGLDKIKIPDWVPDMGGKGINISPIPRLATGTNYVPQDGLAYLHEGEAVVPKRYNPSAGGNNSQGSGATTINFDFSNAQIYDKDDFIRELESVINRKQELTSMGAL